MEQPNTFSSKYVRVLEGLFHPRTEENVIPLAYLLKKQNRAGFRNEIFECACSENNTQKCFAYQVWRRQVLFRFLAFDGIRPAHARVDLVR